MNTHPARPGGSISPLQAAPGPQGAALSLVAVLALLAWGLAEGWALLRSRLRDRVAGH